MVVVGADVHKRTHTFVAVDGVGRKLGEKVVAATSAGHHQALLWARKQFGSELVWGIEDCRHLSARLELDLLSAGQQVIRVPPKLMAQVRASARTRGKSDPIDALVTRSGNRQLNAALHRIAITQIRLEGLGQTYYRTRLSAGDSSTEALRCLKRRLARVVFHHLHTDHQNRQKPCQPAAA